MGAGLLAAIASLAAPMVARVLIALGFSVVTLTGALAVTSQLRTLVTTNLSAGPLAGLQLAGLGGCWIALGMVFGAMTFSLTIFGLTKAVRIVGVGT